MWGKKANRDRDGGSLEEEKNKKKKGGGGDGGFDWDRGAEFIDISSINTHPNGPADPSEWEIDQEAEVLADVWKENIPLTCCEEGRATGERTLEDDQMRWGYRKKGKTES